MGLETTQPRQLTGGNFHFLSHVMEKSVSFMSPFMSYHFPFNNFLFIVRSRLFFFSFHFLPSTLFTAQMPAKFRKNKVKPRGVSNRNRGLEWIRANASDGVLYFADDDNTYDLDIFDEVRSAHKNVF
jgi:Glycosyltransferase family 43